MNELIAGFLCLILIFFVYGLIPVLMVAIPAHVISYLLSDEFNRTLKWLKGKLNFKKKVKK